MTDKQVIAQALEGIADCENDIRIHERNIELEKAMIEELRADISDLKSVLIEHRYYNEEE